MDVLAREIIRDTFLEKKGQPTTDSMYERIVDVLVKDAENLNLLSRSDIPIPESSVWIWSRSAPYQFMNCIEFVYEASISHYQDTRYREDIVMMCDDYLEWKDYY